MMIYICALQVTSCKPNCDVIIVHGEILSVVHRKMMKCMDQTDIAALYAYSFLIEIFQGQLSLQIEEDWCELN